MSDLEHTIELPALPEFAEEPLVDEPLAVEPVRAVAPLAPLEDGPRYLAALESREWARGLEEARRRDLESELAFIRDRLGLVGVERDALSDALEELKGLGHESSAPAAATAVPVARQPARIAELEGVASSLGRALQAQTDVAHLATSQIAAIERAAGELRGRVRFLEDELVEARRGAEDHVRAARSSDAAFTASQRELAEAGERIQRLEAAAAVAARAGAAGYESLKRSHHEQSLLLERTRGALEERELQIRRLERNLRRRDGATPDAAAAAPGELEAIAPGGFLKPLDGTATRLVPGGQRTSIGRARENNLCIEDASISRHHAVILASAAGTFIEDLNSVNGVGINGRRVRHARLAEGDVLTLGNKRYQFSSTDRSAASA